MRADESVYVIGDVHGQLGKVSALLRGAGLVGDDLSWAAGRATLWFIGDFFDRGPDGVGVVDLVMRLQGEAAVAGGRVAALLGNHEVMLLAARRFGDLPLAQPRPSFKRSWELAGGMARDLARLTPSVLDWLNDLPAMAHVGEYLFVHANSLFYMDYGASLAEVNAAIKAILRGSDVPAWSRLIDGFRTRWFFDDARKDGKENAMRFLRRFGGRCIVHGHVPIHYMTGQAMPDVREPLIYAGGLCINVDGAMSADGPGFVYELPRLNEPV